MTNILEKIIQDKKESLNLIKKKYSLDFLENKKKMYVCSDIKFVHQVVICDFIVVQFSIIQLQVISEFIILGVGTI